jgi:hypothetical protein
MNQAILYQCLAKPEGCILNRFLLPDDQPFKMTQYFFVIFKHELREALGYSLIETKP